MSVNNKIQVELSDGSVVDFTKFVVKSGKDKSNFEKFDDYEDAKIHLQQLDRDEVKDFMLSNGYTWVDCGREPDKFINWYANLGMFKKSEFLKLLQKVVMDE